MQHKPEVESPDFAHQNMQKLYLSIQVHVAVKISAYHNLLPINFSFFGTYGSSFSERAKDPYLWVVPLQV